MDWASILWLVLLLLFLMVEAGTVAMMSMWFAAGALVALIFSLLGAGLPVQIGAFLVVSVVLLALLRPVVRKFIHPKLAKTNVDSVIGSRGYVMTTIDNVSATGQVKLGSMEWTARSASGDMIPQGTLVQVERVEGVKVFVNPVQETANI